MNQVQRELLLLLLSGAIVTSLFLLQGWTGFSLMDEGYLWYGSQRVMLGEIPLQDFMSYDPGRYYWSAAIMTIVGSDGIVALRIAVAVFQVLGLFLALSLLMSSATRPNGWWIVFAAGTLLLWMYPRHKLFDITLSIALVALLEYLIEQPSARRYFITGMAVGLIAVFGRNHGMYGAVGSLGAIIYLSSSGNYRSFFPAFGWWMAGICVGYLPVLLLLLSASGFATEFWDSIRFLFEVKATNLPLPVLWPWQVPFGRIPLSDALRNVTIGICFVGLPVFGVAGIGYAIWARMRKIMPPPALVAAAFMALPYAQYAYSRADVGHLALGIFPFLIGVLVFLASRPVAISIPGAAGLLLASLLVMLPLHPGRQASVAGNWIESQVGTDRLRIDPNTTKDLELLKKVVGQYAADGGTFIVTPLWPGAYAVFNRKSPMWEIYALFPRTAEFQQKEIKRIEEAAPRFAVVNDYALDGRDALRFRNTHPLVYQYIRDHFEYQEELSAGPAFQVYKSRRGAQ